jgi:predicted Zn-dependent protease
MKKTVYVLVMMTLLIGVTACQKREEALASLESKEVDNERMKALLVRLGFAEKNIEDAGDYFIADKDIVISKQDLQDKLNGCDTDGESKSGRKDQYALNGNGIVGWTKMGTTTYRIEGSVGWLPNSADWYTAIRQAVTNWNNVGEDNINIVETTGAADIVIYGNATAPISCLQDISPGTFAVAVYPTNNNPGYAVSINGSGPASNLNGKITIMTHELGHCLGFRHSDWQNRVQTGVVETVNEPNGCGNPYYGANLLFNTPERDLGSIMISGVTGFDLITLNAADVRSARMLYPNALAAPQLDNVAVGTGIVSFTVSNVDPKAAFLLLYSTREVTFPSPGTVIVQVNNSRYNPANGSYVAVVPADFTRTARTYYVRTSNYKGDFLSNLSNGIRR